MPIGCNAGEFGGSLWWASRYGRRRTKLLDQNVQGLAPHPGGVMVLTGLSHLTLDYGPAFDATQATSGGWRVQPIVDLDSEPVAFAVDKAGSFVVLTWKGPCRVTPATATLLVKADMPYPTTLALLPNGEIYAGMRLFTAVSSQPRRATVRNGSCRPTVPASSARRPSMAPCTPTSTTAVSHGPSEA